MGSIGSCLKGLDGVERTAGGSVLRGSRSTLEMACKFRGRRCIPASGCAAWAAFGSCLKGLDVVDRAVACTFVAGAAFPAAECQARG